jgi:hypothetical protein
MEEYDAGARSRVFGSSLAIRNVWIQRRRAGLERGSDASGGNDDFYGGDDFYGSIPEGLHRNHIEIMCLFLKRMISMADFSIRVRRSRTGFQPVRAARPA